MIESMSYILLCPTGRVRHPAQPPFTYYFPFNFRNLTA